MGCVEVYHCVRALGGCSMLLLLRRRVALWVYQLRLGVLWRWRCADLVGVWSVSATMAFRMEWHFVANAGLGCSYRPLGILVFVR